MFPISPGGFLVYRTVSLAETSIPHLTICAYSTRKSKNVIILHLLAHLGCFQGSFLLESSFDHLDNPRDTFDCFFEDSWVSRHNLFKQNTPRRDSTLNFY